MVIIKILGLIGQGGEKPHTWFDIIWSFQEMQDWYSKVELQDPMMQRWEFPSDFLIDTALINHTQTATSSHHSQPTEFILQSSNQTPDGDDITVIESEQVLEDLKDDVNMDMMVEEYGSNEDDEAYGDGIYDAEPSHSNKFTAVVVNDTADLERRIAALEEAILGSNPSFMTIRRFSSAVWDFLTDTTIPDPMTPLDATW